MKTRTSKTTKTNQVLENFNKAIDSSYNELIAAYAKAQKKVVLPVLFKRNASVEEMMAFWEACSEEQTAAISNGYK